MLKSGAWEQRKRHFGGPKGRGNVGLQLCSDAQLVGCLQHRINPNLFGNLARPDSLAFFPAFLHTTGFSLLPQRRGPKAAWSDAVLLEKIREVIAASPFYGEGHRKVWAGAAALCGSARVQDAGAAADARSTSARAVAHVSEGRESIYRHDHHRAAQRSGEWPISFYE